MLQESYGELEAKADELKELKLTADQLISGSDSHTQGGESSDAAAELKTRFDRLDKQLSDLRAKADKHKVSVYFSILHFLLFYYLGGLAQLVTSLVAPTKLIDDRPGEYLDG